MAEKEQIVIELKNGKMAILSIQEFDPEIEVDEILRIDYGNIMGEILTFPLLFNRIANLKAEQEAITAETKLDLDIFEAQLMSEHRRKLMAGSEKGKATAAEVECALKEDARYRVKMANYINVQKSLAYMDSLYWSAKSKDTKLDRLSLHLKPEEFERDLVETTINGIQIKMTKKSIN